MIIQLPLENHPNFKFTTGIDNLTFEFKLRFNEYLGVYSMDVDSPIISVNGILVRAGIDLFANFGIKYQAFFVDRLDESKDCNTKNCGITGFIYVYWEDD